MDIMKNVCKQLKGEVKSAEDYGKMALKLKDADKMAANMYYEIANQEYEHAERLQKYCNKHMEELDDPHLKALWEWEKESLAEDMRDIKRLFDMYK